MESNTQLLQRILGLTLQRICQLADEGIIPKPQKKGEYDLPVCVRQYYEYIHEINKSGDIDGVHEKARKMRAEADRIELELAIKKGKVHSSEDVEAVLNDMISFFRSKMLALPTKLAKTLAEEGNPRKIKKTLDDEVCEALNELSEYDPEYFYSQNSEYYDMADIDNENGEEGTNTK